MNKTRSIFRVVFLILAVILLVNLNAKTGTIAEFKIKMIEKLRTDSLDSKQKVDLLVNETTKFIDDSSHIRKGVHYLMGLLGLWVTVELGYLIQAGTLRRSQ